jgi:hypothetical protein
MRLCTRSRRVRLKNPRIAVGVAGFLLAASLAVGDETDKVPQPRCEIAVVNPVSNYAECVKPRGAHVDPPPKRAAPTEEECQRHSEVDVGECRQYESPPVTAPQG